MKIFLRILFYVMAVPALILLLAWGTLAIYYSNLPWNGVRLVLAIIFLSLGIWTFFINQSTIAICLFSGLFICLIIWWNTIKPSHNRPWRPEVAVMPRVTIKGDSIHITGYRNFQYKSVNDFTMKLEEKDYQFSHLTSVDFFVSYWKVGPVGHTFLSFNFDNALPLCISIETRPEVGEGFAPIASLFKQFELIYVVGDERDLVGVRTNHRHEETFLYPMNVSKENAQKLLQIYLDRINELADQPEFYHLLSNSCTVNIVRYADKVGRSGGIKWQHILNGFIDRYLYIAGYIDTSIPFEELRKHSRINNEAQAGNAEHNPDFSKRIRSNLPRP